MSSKDDTPTKFLWLDMEFTGLDVTGNRITEVAVIITDKKLEEIATYQSAVAHDQNSIRKKMTDDPFWGQRPEQMEEILTDMKSGKPEKEVENDLVTMVAKYYVPGEAVYLAGNSIRVDRLFVDYWLPKFAALLHYRMLDVTAFKLWWLASGRGEYLAPKQHRAIDDIRRSITELKHYSKSIK